MSRLSCLTLVAAVVMAMSHDSHAVGWDFRLELGAAFEVDHDRQKQVSAGGEVGVHGGLEVLRWLDLQVGALFVGLAPNDNNRTGLMGGLGGGLRFKTPRDSSWAVQPWLDFDALYLRDNDRNSFGYTVGAGLNVPLDDGHRYHFGPFVRWLQAVNASDKVLIVGASFELGSASKAVAVTPQPAAAPADRDHDGVVDTEDKCPDVAGTVENHGCPADRDHDGVVDTEDKCPDVAGTVENHGCPADRDNDGVPDAEDNCPDKAGPVENHGCPVYKSVNVSKGKIEILQRVEFATGKAQLLPKSTPILDEVAKVLVDNPSLRVQVEGHTDSVGNADKNLKLSGERAAAVCAYLVKKGVANDRLVSKGFGSTMPIAPNDTAKGRETNRRVEFKIIP